LGAGDIVCAILVLFFIVFETIADIQQWKFQRKKWQIIKAGITLPEEYKVGFLRKGLWAYSRHPNYFAEQCIWIFFYAFAIAASGEWINWSIAGCLLLVLLFQGSASFSEEISASKYPEYKNYQQQVSKFIPVWKKKKEKLSTKAVNTF
jgi:steroid 5-alpha reductase family enzyme